MNNTAHNPFKKGDIVRNTISDKEYTFVEYSSAFTAKVEDGHHAYDFNLDYLELVVPTSKTPRTDAVRADFKLNIVDHAEQLETELDAKSGIVDALEEELEKTKNALARADHDRHVNADLHERAIVDRDDAVSIRDEWAAKAKYYHSLLEQCGYTLGREAYTYADGTLQSDVIVAKVPELVRELAEARKRLIEELNRQKLSKPEPIDHTEGGKYRMLEEGEPIERGDQYFWHDENRWEPAVNYVGRGFHESFWGSPMRRRIDYAQQAKAILQRQFGVESPFRKIDLDTFVDLIIKAAKA